MPLTIRSLSGGKSTLGALLLAALVPAVALAEGGAPGWEAAKAAIAAQFKPDEAQGDRVVSIEENSRAELFPFYARYFGEVLLERKDKTREKHKVWLDFVLVNHRWEVEGFGGLELKALADVKPPAASEAEKLLVEAWKPCEGFEVVGAKLKAEPEFQREPNPDRAKARRGFIYSAEIAAVGTGVNRLSDKGAEYRADTRNILWLDAGTHAWSVDRRAIRCGFQKTKDAPAVDSKPASISGSEATVPAAADVAGAFKRSWSRVRPDFDVRGVTLVKPGELHHSGAKSWVTCKLSVEVVGTPQGPKEWSGKNLRCTPEDFSSVLNWNAGEKSWVVDEKTVKDVNERGVCK